MIKFGELSDEQMAKKIQQALKQNEIEVVIERNSTNGILSLFVSDEAYLPRAHDCFRVHLGFPPQFDLPPEMEQISRLPWGYITKILMIFGTIIGGWLLYLETPEQLSVLFMSETDDGFLVEVLAGQWWRLWTPIFLHFGILHILFNMICFKDFGSLVEHQHGVYRYLVLIAVIGLVSNLGQYAVAGPKFGGFSGVLFGLLGLVWVYKVFNPLSEFALPKSSVVMLLVWFFLCLVGVIPGIANTAHALGLSLGIFAGIFLGVTDYRAQNQSATNNAPLPLGPFLGYSMLSLSIAVLTYLIEGFKLGGEFYYLRFFHS